LQSALAGPRHTRLLDLPEYCTIWTSSLDQRIPAHHRHCTKYTGNRLTIYDW